MEAEAFEVIAGEGVGGVGGRAGEEAELVEDVVGGWEGLGAWRDVEEDVEVIGHDGEGEDADGAEAFAFAEEAEEVEFLRVAEDEATVDDAGDAVVIGVTIGWEFEAWEAHGKGGKVGNWEEGGEGKGRRQGEGKKRAGRWKKAVDRVLGVGGERA
jgi:hypothetical protein